MTQNLATHVGLLGACLLLASIAGCGGGPDPNEALARVNGSNIQRLGNLYVAYQSTHNWNGPADEAALKDFVRTFDPTKLARINIAPATVDALFISERDKQPFKIRYSVKGNSMGSSEPVIFEAVGVDGKRQIGRLNMTQVEADQAEYDTLWSGKGPVAPPTRMN